MKQMKKTLPVLLCAVFVLVLTLGFGLKVKAAEPASGTFGENNALTWTYDGAETLTFSGTGAMPDYTGTGVVPWRNTKSYVKQVVIEENITSIGAYSLAYFSALETVTVKGGLTAIGASAFWNSSVQTVVIEGSAGNLAENAFMSCKQLISFSAESVGDVGVKCFYGCSALSSFVSETTVGDVAERAFYEGSAMTEFAAPDGIGSVGEYGFYKCGMTGTINLKNAETIANYAFCNAVGITEVILGENAREIGVSAFLFCEGIEEVTILCPTAHVGDGAFSSCTNLEKVNAERTVTYENRVFSDTVWDNYFGKCGDNVYWIIEGDTMTLYGEGRMTSAPKGSNLQASNAAKQNVKKIVVEEGITNLYQYAFADGCSNVESITVPSTLTEIGDRAISNTKITEFVIPDSVTKIGDAAFYYNENLESLKISENVTELGDYLFEGSGIKNLILEPEFDYDYNFFEDCNYLENVEIKKGTIGYGAFNYSAETLKSIVLGDGVTSIGDEAFANCVNLKEVDFPESVEEIGRSAFKGCLNLERISFQEGLLKIGAYAFANCTALKEAEIPLSVTAIGDYAFNGVVSDEIGKEDIYIAGEEFLIRGYINTEAERYASGRYYNCTFEAIGGDISVCKMTLSPVFFIYDGTAKEPTVTVKTPLSGTELVCGTMYTEPVYENNIEVGKEASATVDGIGKWYGTLSKTFEIAAADQGGEEPDEPKEPENPTISEEGMMYMYEVMLEMGLIDQNTTKFSAEQYEETIAMFAEFGYSRADAEYFMETYEFWGGASADEGFGEEPVYRVFGQSRYETSYKTADVLKEQLGVDKFDTAIVAYGKNFPDALAGSYLAGKTNAPILMINDKFADELTAYVKENVKKGGTIYVLGGEGAIPDSQLKGLGEYEVCRLAGETRYETNLKILEEAGVGNQDILVCTGKNFADSLSASATGKPILLLNNKTLTAEQRAFLEQHEGGKFYVIGGEGAVSEKMADEIREYGSVERIYGNSRYETSVKLAEKFFSNAEVSVLASAKNFPDGLCGGPLAMSKNAPLILTATGKEAAAVEYMNKNNISIGAVLGGDSLISDEAVEEIYGVPSISIW